MKTPRPLTPRQAEVLGFIREHMAGHGYAPSVREIAAHFGFGNPSGAMCHVVALCRKGVLVQASEGKARGYVPASVAGCCRACGRPVRKEVPT